MIVAMSNNHNWNCRL